MLSDDVYKSRLRTTVTALEAWLDGLRGVSHIDTAQDDASWSVRSLPFSPDACPFELVLRLDQHFDLSVANEVYEDQPVMGLDGFQPMLAAIASGEVVTRHWRTMATDALVKVETVFTDEYAISPPCKMTRNLAFAARFANDAMIANERRYVPYARGA